jgi:hypothetical protein
MPAEIVGGHSPPTSRQKRRNVLVSPTVFAEAMHYEYRAARGRGRLPATLRELHAIGSGDHVLTLSASRDTTSLMAS